MSTAEIPSPPALPIVGHALSTPVDRQVAHLCELARTWGPIFKLGAFGEESVIVTGLDLVTELCDETRFRKNVHPDLVNLRPLAGDGLFTAYGDEPNWRKAHDILLPAFSVAAMRGYHATMLDVARKLVDSWSRKGPEPVQVSADMTRLTLDTIGLCGFGYDFASFESAQPHPFIGSLVGALGYAQAKGAFIPGLDVLYRKRTRQFHQDVRAMEELVDELIRLRRQSGDQSTGDLLGRMLHSIDPETGEPLDDLNIRYQVITFLIAGHETTSGALSFALYYLARNPVVLARVQEEVDTLWGDAAEPDPSYADVGRLSYTRQVLMESLRLWPTAPGFAVEALADTVIGGRYEIKQGESLFVLTPQLHRDPAWGRNVELFDPDRFAPEAQDARPPHAFKAFGSGERACIGRQFALHEATLVLGLLAHRFHLAGAADYDLEVKETLTLKPDGFTLQVEPRTTADRRTRPAATAPRPEPVEKLAAPGSPLTILYGSNMGTCSAIAHDLAAEAEERGFAAKVSSLDEAAGTLADTPVVIVAASYNGRPTDDATRFVDWLAEADTVPGTPYAVLGVGDRNWAATFQRVPKLIDERLAATGATRLAERGVADASGDLEGAIDAWSANLWPALTGPEKTQVSAVPEGPAFRLEPVTRTPAEERAEHHGVRPMRVLLAEPLTHPDGRQKRHLRLELPQGATYRTGDHLAVLPENPPHLVERAAARFGLNPAQLVRLRQARRTRTQLPVDTPVTVRELLSGFLELQRPATATQIRALAAHTRCPNTKAALEAEDPASTTVLTLLDEHPACELPFEVFLELMPALRPRNYSISTSPLTHPGAVDLMVSQLSAPSRTGAGWFHGVASSHLAEVEPGAIVQARVVPGPTAFHGLSDEHIPAILVSAGTGLAPFRGVVMERLHRRASGTLLCYFGCDAPEIDYLHRAELEAAEAAGVVSLRPTFSETPQNGQRYVQDRLLHEADEVWHVLEAGGRVYVCGDGTRMAPAVRAALTRIHRERTAADQAASETWLEELRATERYCEDIWEG
ncbi:bifunctional cytochrome P450/NADPH--P450 reductase [Nonomuraea endophytica]|uniref:Bifunctional cytochrome P450/NADPH--P450 reductase n=1 Tax=Nonomuraea endophytica TaxID=714136 RepID=A0A7W8A5T1_9ACTN|nr:cytochrome P450 [Nonomuraea endophytica]MBB5080122.1 cytochrome P450/NADPH-cytochrome P450 reductase [Nonomuraea endophytica]